MHEAMLWKATKSGKVQCELCSQLCLVGDGQRGKCGVRVNQGGALHTLVFDKVAAMNLDPIEKKPLFHFMPGTTSFSIGTMGCNLDCGFCQNYTLSKPPKGGGAVRGEALSPAQIVEAAKRSGAASIAYTYSEPTIFFELMYETAGLALKAGLKNVMVSNGYMTTKSLDTLGGLIQAANIDLKAYSDDFYKNVCDASLGPVLENLKYIKHEMGWWLEVTTLVITDLNDSREELEKIATFIAEELSDDTPWHVSRFHPTHKMQDRPSTPMASLERAYNAGKEAGLKYIYVGNVPGHDTNSTFCPGCGDKIIQRNGFSTGKRKIKDSACVACGEHIPGVEL